MTADAQTSAANAGQDDRLPDAVLERMPELIFDSFRKLLWQLEVDGMYGLEAGHHATGYIRRSFDELRANGGQLVALMRDSRARGGDGLLALTDQNRTSA